VVWRGGELLAVEPNGRVHWSLARTGRIAAARWSPADGYRIAYLSGATMRVVWGNGVNDRPLGGARAVAPAWRPDRAHVVAYVDAHRRIRVVAVDADRVLWRTRPHSRIFELAWSPDGRRLVAATPRRLLVFSRGGRLLAVRRVAGGRLADDVAFSPAGRLTVVRRGADGSEVVLGGRVVFRGPGRFGPVAWSPSGRRLLVPWPEADQWLFLDARGGRATAVANIARQFARGPAHGAFPGAVEWGD
jgi:Tol biopolymer transport system component